MIDTLTMDVPEAEVAVAGIRSLTEIAQVRAREEAHPRHDGGRKGVLTALADREAELEEELAAAEPEQAYAVGEWDGRPNYECPWCPYATLEKDDIETHVAACKRRPRGGK